MHILQRADVKNFPALQAFIPGNFAKKPITVSHIFFSQTHFFLDEKPTADI
jgi:hypothetical protein